MSFSRARYSDEKKRGEQKVSCRRERDILRQLYRPASRVDQKGADFERIGLDEKKNYLSYSEKQKEGTEGLADQL